MRYIELNPVRARMVEHPGEYRWSSYACNAHGRNDRLITPHPIYAAISADPSARQEAYRELFRAQMEADLLHAIRDVLNHELVLGREDFKDKIEHMSARHTRLGQPGRPRTRRVEEPMADYYVL